MNEERKVAGISNCDKTVSIRTKNLPISRAGVYIITVANKITMMCF